VSVQVERIGDVIAVRSRGDRMRHQLLFSLAEWEAFLAGAAAGRFTPEALR
jgi:hypothetical protein